MEHMDKRNPYRSYTFQENSSKIKICKTMYQKSILGIYKHQPRMTTANYSLVKLLNLGKKE